MMQTFRDIARVEQPEGTNGCRYFECSEHIVFLNCQHVRATHTAEYQAHRFREYELIVPVSGIYRCSLDGRRLRVRPGEFLLVQPFQEHGDELKRNVAYDCFHFMLRKVYDRKEIPSVFREGTSPGEQVAPLPESYAVLSKMLWDELERNGFNAVTYPLVNALMQSLFQYLLQGFPAGILRMDFRKDSVSRSTGMVLAALFGENAGRNLSVDEMCHATALSRSSLARVCRKIFSLPPAQAFMDYRVQCARQWLESHPGLRIKEVAVKFGFANAYHFSRVFRKYVGTSPSRRRVE